MDSHEPPLQETYEILLLQSSNADHHHHHHHHDELTIEDCDLPSVDLSRLSSDDMADRENCIHEITQAAKDWGFFQVVNHGISNNVLMSLETEQKKLFYEPFYNKIDELNIGYRWGNSMATCVNQLSWSEGFHLSISDISSMNKCQRLAIKRFAKKTTEIAQTLTGILVQNLGSVQPTCLSQENCTLSSSYLRLNRYPPCPFSSSGLVLGLIPHTDSDFISIVHQDHTGGLQLLKDGNWIGVNPNPQALIINIGDLFQVVSNGVYKSVKHRVIATEAERFSQAYFYCPTDETILESCTESPPLYRNFSFREYKEQVRNDVRETGDKIGLQKFLL